MANHQPVLGVLVQAMITEQDGYDFYIEAAKRVGDSKGKAMFNGLANDEVGHLQIIQNEYARVNAGKALSDLDTARKEHPVQPSMKLFPEKSKLSSMLNGATTDEGALKVALEFELKGYQMYDAAAKSSADQNAAQVFAYLAKQENHHYELLQKTQQYLRDKGAWFFDELEKPMFEG
jgi:erythrin-vacuolar iron transport family protein